MAVLYEATTFFPNPQKLRVSDNADLKMVCNYYD